MYKVAALYKFTKILNPFKIHNNIRSKLKNHNVNGTILVGEEGINGTISSNSKNNLDKAIEFISKLEGVTDVDLKLVWEPPWDKDKMSEAAKLELNL